MFLFLFIPSFNKHLSVQLLVVQLHAGCWVCKNRSPSHCPKGVTWGDRHITSVHHNEVKIGMEILTRLVRNPPCTRWQQVEFLNQVVDVLTPLSQVEGWGCGSR